MDWRLFILLKLEFADLMRLVFLAEVLAEVSGYGLLRI